MGLERKISANMNQNVIATKRCASGGKILSLSSIFQQPELVLTSIDELCRA